MNGQAFAQMVLTNAALAAFLALAVALFARHLAHPWMVRAAWLIILVRLLAPPAVPLRVFLPAPPAGEADVAITTEFAVMLPAGQTGRGAPSLPSPWLLLWLAGALGLAGLWGRQAVRLTGAVRRCSPPPAELNDLMARRARALRVRAPRLLLVEDGCCPPAVLALPGRRVLLLPAGLLDVLRQAELDALITHELTHLARRDHWVRLLELAALLTYWWHPVAWWAARRARQAEEQACDAAVRKTFPELAQPLARCLVQVARTAPPAAPLLASSFADIAQLERRVAMLTRGLFTRRPRLAEAAVLTLLLAALVVTPVLTTAGTPQWPATAEQPITIKVEGATVAEVLRVITEASGITVHADPELLERTVTLGLAGTPVHMALEGLARGMSAVVTWQDGDAVISMPLAGTEAVAPGPETPAGERFFQGRPAPRVGPATGIQEPRKVHDARPSYPEAARRERVQGVVVLELIVDEEGRVAEVDVLRGQPMGLTEAAVDAVRQWRYEPVLVDGEAVPVTLVATINFRLETGGPQPATEWQGRPVHRTSPGTEPPTILSQTPPAYPEEARRAGVEGVVVLECIVDEEGRVVSAQVLRGQPLGLSEAAVEAVLQWRYEPVLKDGQPVVAAVVVTVNFRLAE